MRWAVVLALLALTAWLLAGYRADRSYARREYEVEAVEAPSSSTLSFIDFAGEARTFVFRAPNGHVYSAYYQLTPRGARRMRRDYVFGRILASLKFKP